MRAATAWQAMAQHPFAFLASAWPWRALLYLVSGVVLGGSTVGVLVAVHALHRAGGGDPDGTVVTLVTVVGAVLFLGIAMSAVGVARMERWRLRLVDLDQPPDPHRPPLGPGLRAWVATRIREPVTWREVGFTIVSATALCWLDLTVLAFAFALPVLFFQAPADDPGAWPWVIIGVVVLAGVPYTITSWAGARAALARTFLAPRDGELGDQLVEVSESRARLVDAFEVERSRIERGLHDGAQQRLVSLSMLLGLARLDVPDGTPLARQLGEVQDQLTVALAELRDLVRGLNPQVLADNGLVAAVEDNAGRSPVPVTVDVRLPHRLPPHIESTAYYVITEAMANIAKHSGASAATVYGRHHTDVLVLEITDNGVGGADPAGSTGLTGLAERLGVVDGRLRLSSPPGGPTKLRVDIPCRFG